MKLIRAFLVVLSVSSVDAARVSQLAEAADEVIGQVEDVSQSSTNSHTYDYYTGTHMYHYYSGSTAITTTTVNQCGFPQKEAHWLLLVVMKHPNVKIWMEKIEKFEFHCSEKKTLISSEFQKLLKDYGLKDLPPIPPKSQPSIAWRQQRAHRTLLLPSFKEELKSFARTGAKRQMKNVGCSDVPGSKEKKGTCVCSSSHVIKGFAPHCRVKNVRTFSAKDYLGCVCKQRNHFVSGPCKDFGAPKIKWPYLCDSWNCRTRGTER